MTGPWPLMKLRDAVIADEDGNEVFGTIEMSLDVAPAILVIRFGDLRISVKETEVIPFDVERNSTPNYTEHCATCGHPRGSHPFRHPFASPKKRPGMRA